MTYPTNDGSYDTSRMTVRQRAGSSVFVNPGYRHSLSISSLNMDMSLSASASTTGNHDDDVPQGEPVAISELPPASSFIEAEVPQVHPAFEDRSGGYFGALQRTLSGVPPYIWVENTIDESITVVVSKFKASTASGGQVSMDALMNDAKGLRADLHQTR